MMKKLLFSSLFASLVLCLSLNFAHAMKRDDHLIDSQNGVLTIPLQETREDHEPAILKQPIFLNLHDDISHNILMITQQGSPQSLCTLLCVCERLYVALIGKTKKDVSVPKNRLVPLDFSSYRVKEVWTRYAGIADTGITNIGIPNIKYEPKVTNLVLKNWSQANITALDLEHNQIIQDQDIQNLVDLTYLNLSYNKSITGNGIDNFTKLKVLNLWNNPIIRDETLKNFINLTTLNLIGKFSDSTNSSITDNSVKYLTNLTNLKLSYQNKTITNESIKNLTNLTKLELSDDRALTDEVFQYLITLKDLRLYNNTIITDEGIKNLTNLTKLYLNCGAPVLKGEGLKFLVNLEDLTLNHMEFVTDECIKGLTNLTTLFLDYDHPEDDHRRPLVSDNGIITLTKLTTLKLSYIEHITNNGVRQLPNLTSLDLENNEQITDKGIKRLTNLTDLKLNNQITWEGVKNLKKIDPSVRESLLETYYQNKKQELHNARSSDSEEFSADDDEEGEEEGEFFPD